MATVYFACSGIDPGGAEVEREVTIQVIMQNFDAFDTMFSENPTVRDFDKDSPHDGDFAHVVLKIEEDETNKKFAEPGFYWVLDLSPEDCMTILGDC